MYIQKRPIKIGTFQIDLSVQIKTKISQIKHWDMEK